MTVPPAAPVSRADLDVRQVRAIDGFNSARRARELALAATARTREMRLDSARALEALRRSHEALVARAEQQLRESGGLLRQNGAPRAVLAHRDAWFLEKACTAFLDAGVEVVARTDNGADAIGTCVAEQPELLLLEDSLVMVPGLEVVEQTRLHVPGVVVGVRTVRDEAVGRLLDAGASAVFARQVPAAEVVASLLRLTPV